MHVHIHTHTHIKTSQEAGKTQAKAKRQGIFRHSVIRLFKRMKHKKGDVGNWHRTRNGDTDNACKKSYHSQHSLTLLHFPRKTTLTYTFVSKAFIKNPFECVSQKLGDTAHAIINRK